MVLSLPQLLLGITLLAFAWLVIDWFLASLRDRSEERRLRKTSRVCHLCNKRYPEGRRTKLSECPDCAASNVRGGHRKLG